ncbi:hypothetical protein AGMMS50239_40830 [Bacteroidia bacterium]|nr:hypothetical protein AGMMS50239_40830 [Bacteroidia bacterium]
MKIYTDGSCQLNPGIGGWSFVIIPNIKSDRIIISAGGNPSTTSNRMELTAILRALAFCMDSGFMDDITVFTDSQYAARAISENWIERWVDCNFKNIKNQDLWLQIYKYICKLNVNVVWVKGHNGDMYNELADRLAKDACFYQGSIQEIKNPAAQLNA